MSPLLRGGIDELRRLARAAPNAWPAVILASVSKLIETISNSRTAVEDLRSLSNRILDVTWVLVVALSREDVVVDAPLHTSLNETTKTIERLALAVHNQLSRRKLESFLLASSDKLSVKQAQQDFELALDSVNLCLNMSNLQMTDSLQGAMVREAKQEVDAAEWERLSVFREEIQKLERSQHKFIEHILPALSGVFYGREQELELAVKLLTQQEQTAIAILGPGGMGKTSLALATMHHNSIADRYGSNRYFIVCDATVTTDGVLERFAAILGVDERRPIASLRSLMSEANRPLLVTFDNFETPWEPPENRSKLEGFLSDLISTPNVSILVTLRGAERPANIQWSKPFLPPLQPLDLQSAIRVFTSISDAPEDDPYMTQLILAVDMIPLAVTLIATQAQYTSCRQLLDQWTDEKTKMVSRGYDGRLSSLSVSIEISLQSSRFKQEPSGMRLLQLLSILPDGAPDWLLDALTEDGFPLASATSTLLKVSLALRDNQDRLWALSPVREYISSASPIVPADLTIAFSFIEKVARQFWILKGQQEAQEMRNQWLPQFGNITSFLMQCLSRPSDIAPRNSTKVICMLHYLFQGFVAPTGLQRLTLEAVSVARTNGLRLQEAKLAQRTDYVDCDIDAILDIFRECGELDSLMEGLTDKGNHLWHSENQYPTAVLEECLRLDRAKISPQTLLEFLAFYATVLMALSTAKSYEVLLEALSIAEAERQVSTMTHLYSRLARVERVRGFYSKSHLYYQASLAYTNQPNLSFGTTLMNMAYLSALRGNMEEAERLLVMTFQLFSVFGRSHDWGASAKNHEFTIFSCQGRFPEAEASHNQLQQMIKMSPTNSINSLLVFNLARNTLDELESRVDELMKIYRAQRVPAFNNSRFLIAEFHLRKGRTQEAFVEFVHCLLAARKLGCRLVVAMIFLRLGDVYRVGDQDMEEANILYRASYQLIQHTGAPRHLGDALVRISICQRYLGDIVSARKSIAQAMKLFGQGRFPPGVEWCGTQSISETSGGAEEYFSLEATPQASLLGWTDNS